MRSAAARGGGVVGKISTGGGGERLAQPAHSTIAPAADAPARTERKAPGVHVRQKVRKTHKAGKFFEVHMVNVLNEMIEAVRAEIRAGRVWPASGPTS